MPRPRKPTNVLQLKGRIRNNPYIGKEREGEPDVRSISGARAPDWMKAKDQRACYREILRKAPAGVMGMADTVLIEIVSCLLAEYRRNPDGMKAAKLARLTTGLAQLGMTPADRSRTSAIEKPMENPFAEFAQ